MHHLPAQWRWRLSHHRPHAYLLPPVAASTYAAPRSVSDHASPCASPPPVSPPSPLHSSLCFVCTFSRAESTPGCASWPNRLPHLLLRTPPCAGVDACSAWNLTYTLPFPLALFSLRRPAPTSREPLVSTAAAQQAAKACATSLNRLARWWIDVIHARKPRETLRVHHHAAPFRTPGFPLAHHS